MASEVRNGIEVSAKPRVTLGEAEAKLEDHVVRTEGGKGWRANEALAVEVIPAEEAEKAGGQAVIEAVRKDRAARGAKSPVHQSNVPLTPLGQPFAMYRHPSEFTEEEDAVIINGMLAQLPLYMIAEKLRCSRTVLANHIRESKLLSQVVVDRDESFLDRVEWSALKLIEAGNPAMIMFALERKGESRGWGQGGISDVDMEDSRIVIGEIPESEVEEAEKRVKEIEAKEGVDSPAPAASSSEEKGDSAPASAAKLPSPMEMALMEDAAKRAAEEVQKERDANTVSIPPEDVRVEPAPWDDGYGGGEDPFGGGGFDGFM